MYKSLSELAKFCRRYDKNVLAYFFLGHGVYVCLFIMNVD